MVQFPARRRFFYTLRCPTRPCSPSRTILVATENLSPGLKWAGYGTNHSPACSTMAKNVWKYTSTSPCILTLCTCTTLPLPNVKEKITAYSHTSLYLYFVTFLLSMLVFHFLNCFLDDRSYTFCCTVYFGTAYLLPLAYSLLKLTWHETKISKQNSVKPIFLLHIFLVTLYCYRCCCHYCYIFVNKVLLYIFCVH